MINKVIGWIKQHKRLVVIVLLVLAAVISIAVLLLKPKVPSIPAPGEKLSVIATIPPPGEFRSVWTTDKITFVFDEKISPKTVDYSITPYVRSRTVIPEGPTDSFSIISLDGWRESIEYTITLSKNLTSLDNKKLGDDYIFKFTRVVPQPGDPDYPKPIQED